MTEECASYVPMYLHAFICVYVQISLGCHNKIPWTGWLNQEKKISPVLVARSVSSGYQYSCILVRSPFLTFRQLPSHCICHRWGRRGMHAHVFPFLKKKVFLAKLHSIWDLSSPIRDQTCSPCFGSTES